MHFSLPQWQIIENKEFPLRNGGGKNCQEEGIYYLLITYRLTTVFLFFNNGKRMSMQCIHQHRCHSLHGK